MQQKDRRQLRAQFEANRQKFDAANARVTERVGRNLVFALASGLLLAAIFLISVFVWTPLLLVVALLFGIMAMIELATAFRQAGRRVPRIGVSLGGAAILIGAYFWGLEGLLWSLFGAALFLMLWRAVESIIPGWKVPWRTLIADLASGVFTLVYIPFLLGIAVNFVKIEPYGEWWVFTLVLLPVVCDIGAWAAGVSFGKHKMAPRISPNKTWEGFAGAAATAVIAGALAAHFFLQQPWWLGVILGLAVLITATAGDLVESLIKRNLNVKDMSNLIPGHGGLLDRLDSILPSVIPVFMAAFLIGVI
ncbi:phosphatidate cytidylyltransferase [Canibacter zhoujuaniae]|uniref:phosphatidate cytidylyltransferase n=1 Tax=Canibacter zhoujuaniae TaxID=2708343 RepID=UPI001420C317|nr:phosphatidate cytidylyltransferase [Canibacter zhoujuaniae]